MNSLSKKFKIALCIGLVCLPMLAALPNIANAQAAPTTPPTVSTIRNGPTTSGWKPSDDPIMGGLEDMFLQVLVAISGVFRLLTEGFMHMIQWMIDFGSTVMDFAVVKSGFEVTLSLVNLLFVMGLIVISFEIILDINAHHAKELLSKVIIYALLINFSLLVAGFLLDISNIFTNFFLKDITAEALRGAFDTSQFAGATFGSSYMAAVMAGLFSIIINAVICIAMAAVWFMATARTVVVAGLLMVMPLTWGMMVFPGLHDHAHDWWKNFIKYGVMYLPTLTFFLWLVVLTARNADFLRRTATLDTGAWGGFLSPIVQMILLIGIIIFGLKSAEEMGGIGSSIGMSMAKKAGSWTKSAGKGLAKAAYTTDIKGYGLQAGVKKIGQGASNVLSNKYVSMIPGATRAANALAGASSRKEDIKTTQKNKYSNLTDAQFEELLANPPWAELERSALLEEADHRHKMGKVPSDQAEQYIKAVKALNPGKDLYDIKSTKSLLSHDPTLGKFARTMTDTIDPNTGKAIKDAAGKTVQHMESDDEAIIRAIRKADSDDAADWSLDHVFEHLKPVHFAAFTNDQVAAIGATGDPRKIKELDKQLEKLENGIGSIADVQLRKNAQVGLERLQEFKRKNPLWQRESAKQKKKEDHAEPHTDAGGGHGGGGSAPHGGGGGGAKPSGGSAPHGGGGGGAKPSGGSPH